MERSEYYHFSSFLLWMAVEFCIYFKDFRITSAEKVLYKPVEV